MIYIVHTIGEAKSLNACETSCLGRTLKQDGKWLASSYKK